jgi:hypothetical protein
VRALNLAGIRSRVERLSAECQPREEGPLLVRWGTPYDACPGCGYDLDGHAQHEALGRATRDRAKPRLVFYSWPGLLTACPRCHAALPYEAAASDKVSRGTGAEGRRDGVLVYPTVAGGVPRGELTAYGGDPRPGAENRAFRAAQRDTDPWRWNQAPAPRSRGGY